MEIATTRFPDWYVESFKPVIINGLNAVCSCDNPNEYTVYKADSESFISEVRCCRNCGNKYKIVRNK